MRRKPLWRLGAERAVSTICRHLPEGRPAFLARSVGFKASTHLPKRALVNPGEVVLQGGCWRVETLVEWSEAVGPGGHVIAVEADPTNVDVLRIEATRRQLDNVSVVERAIWKEPTTLTLQHSEHSKRNKLREASTYSPRQSESNYTEDRETKADTIDNIVNDIDVDTPDHLHLTVSGAEREAVIGMESTLRKPGVRTFIRAILCDEETSEPTNEAIASLLRQRGMDVTLARREPNRGGGGNVYAARL